MRQIQVWRERETSQVEAKGLKKAAFLKRETSVALACYHYGTEGPYTAVITAFSAPNVPLFPPYELKISVPDNGGSVDIEVPKLTPAEAPSAKSNPNPTPERAD